MPELLLPLPNPQAKTTSACLVLIDVVDSTLLAHTLPLTHYMALMSEFVQVMILTLEARGGEVLQHQGDAVLGYWPISQTTQACQAALEAHGRAARLGLAGMLGANLQVRAGVAAGEVITGMVGGQLSAYGLPVNYAKRLCDAAQAGETLACARVSGQLGLTLPVQPRAPLDLQGFGANCQAYRVLVAGQVQADAHMKVD